MAGIPRAGQFEFAGMAVSLKFLALFPMTTACLDEPDVS
jgi:hypothetical protein